MIARDSKSYPYLAIAHYYRVDYGKLLCYSDRLIKADVRCIPAPATQWRYEVWRLEREKSLK